MNDNYYGVSNGITLSICPQEQDYGGSKKAEEASSRFFQVASMLPHNKTLQFQLRFGGENEETKAYAFSNEEGITKEDYDWIFTSCSDAASGDLCREEVCLDGRNVYKIVSCHEDASCDQAAASIRSRDVTDDYEIEYYEDHDREDFPCEDFKGFLKMLSELSGDMRIISKDKHSELWIALSDEMPFRMRALLAFIFPHTEAKLIDDHESSPDEKPVEDQLALKKSMKYALAFLMDKKDKNKGSCTVDDSQSSECSDRIDPFGIGDVSNDTGIADGIPRVPDNNDGTSYDPYSISIDELELSIRAYNCLMRAGVSTIGRLKEMSDEDLRQIRNLGLKSYEEVKQRLSEFEARTGCIKVPELQSTDYSAMLEEMIGLSDVKDQVCKIAAFARMKKDMADKGSTGIPIAFNMEFVGNPGTAKTTVARILAGILGETGIISSGELVEVGRSDLVGKYVGQTAGKVKDVFRRAKGKLLFIDEAYSLVEAWEDSYGDEAIDTIVQEMENNREDTIVIFAGYPNEMAEFFSRNPGLRSRVPFRIEFRDYSADELRQIAVMEAAKRGFEISNDAQEQLLHVCGTAAGKPECGNGRFCRNLIENAILNYAVRCYAADGGQDVKDCRLKNEDFIITKDMQKEKQQNAIGFRIEYQESEGSPEIHCQRNEKAISDKAGV